MLGRFSWVHVTCSVMAKLTPLPATCFPRKGGGQGWINWHYLNIFKVPLRAVALLLVPHRFHSLRK